MNGLITILIISAIVLIGLFDIWLDMTDKKTISQWINGLLPRWADVVIVSLTVAGIGWYGGALAALYAAGLILYGHVLLGHERYKK
jgi:hypothetical protein